MILYGKNSVLERLKINPKSIKKILFSQDFKHSELEKLADCNNIPYEKVLTKELSKIKPNVNLQGVVAFVDDFTYTAFEDLLKQKQKLVIFFLDRIVDPQNLGAIIRVCAFFEKFAIVIPKYKACPINDTVLHVAEGGENYVPISLVNNLRNSIIAAKKEGFWIVGATESKDSDVKFIQNFNFPFPLAVVFGSEAKGIRYGISRHLDVKVNIPTNLEKFSLNVNSACSIFCYEISKQWKRF